jgi:hypothetical protein
MRRVGHTSSAGRLDQRVTELETQAQSVRDLLMSGVGAKEKADA